MVGAFVAANCLDLGGSKALNASTTYAVALYTNGLDTPAVVEVAPSDIAVHPDYDNATLAYNIAVIRLGPTGGGTIKASIVYSPAALAIVYQRLSLSDRQRRWSVSQSPAGNDPQVCLHSPMYASNPLLFSCTDKTAGVNVDGKRFSNIGYGTGRLVVPGAEYAFSLYSHSAASSTNLGAATSVVSYYTALAHHTQFAEKVLKSPVFVYRAQGGTYGQMTTSAVIPATKPQAGVAVVGGDLYPLEGGLPADPTTDASTESGDNDGDGDGDSSSSSSGSYNGDMVAGKSGLSGGAIAGIVVGAAVAAAAAAIVGGRYIARALKRRRGEAYWNREMDRVNSARSLAAAIQEAPGIAAGMGTGELASGPREKVILP
ncbi:hypothetical protein H4R18_003089 [Coemansia javaensis]|uniref:Uncharacterized protein n=1 Tax=Coemansia javaensis TaxID=2761396 RepID=A0A9W8HBD3_9FUNG|nr:hypothetical protein H4R18_003089 [Coemansia javaensis]